MPRPHLFQGTSPRRAYCGIATLVFQRSAAMRNLIVKGCRSSTLQNGTGGGRVTHFCSHAAESRLFVASSQGQLLCYKLNQLEWSVELFPAGMDELHVTALNFSLELDAICAALSSGTLLVVDMGSHEVEEVGSVQDGILAMVWSPSGDVLALVTGSGSLLVMNQSWEPLSETQLVGDADSEVATVCSDATITWRGDGKFFATNVISGGARSVKVWDRTTFEQHSVAEQAADLAAPMCWQPNGRHLYTVEPAQQDAGASGRVRLYEANGLMHGGFELLHQSGRVHGLYWSADSELLAVLLAPSSDAAQADAQLSRSSSWSLQVWHRSNWHWYLKQERRFAAAPGPPLVCWDELQPSLLHVLSANWTHDQMLFQWDSCISDRGTAVVVDGLQLLLTPLRHVRVPPPMCAVRCLLPDAVVAVTISSSVVGADEQIAAVLADGRLALFRSVEEDLWEETLEEQMDAGGDTSALTPRVSEPVIFGGPLHGSCVREVCWLDQETLLVLAACGQQGSALLQLAVSWGPASASSCTQAGLSLVPDVRAIVPHGTWAGYALVQSEAGAVSVYKRLAALQAPQAQPHQAAPQLQLTALEAQATVPVACSWLAAVPPLAPHLGQSSLPLASAAAAPLLGLTQAGQLYWGSMLVASEVTSYAVRAGGGTAGPALLYTTRASLLYTVHFAQLLLGGYQHRELLAADQAPERQQQQQQPAKLGSAGINIKQAERRDDDMRAAMHAAMKPSAKNAAARDVVVRAVEQGSRLVAAPKDDVMVVLQMPRGNLETVCPRALVLAAITQALQEQRFADAWQLASLNRVDLNLLVDYQWPSILESFPVFVQQVPRASDLCDVLFALRPDSVVAPGGIYATADGSVEGSTAAGAAAPSDKVDAVCDALRSAVEALPGGRAKYLNVVVTAFARQSTRQLEQALACIQQAKEAALHQEQQHDTTLVSTSASMTAPAPGDASAEKALKHLLLHVDADELYRVALGMYDLALAYMVIANAQRDPGEYMAELQRFGAIADEKLRQYTIDMHLHRYSQAVHSLFAAGPQHFEQALSLARDKGLLRQLLGLCPEDDSRRLRVLDAYGDSLDADRKHEDAGVAFLAAGQLAKALQSYRAASQWRMVFVLARRLQYSDTDLQHLAVQVSDELTASGQAAAGAAVLLQYLQDVDNAVSLLVQAREWRDALHTAHCHRRQDLVDTVVAPAAAAAASGLLSDARESMERLAKYWARLKEVRGKRLAMEAVIAADAQDGGGNQDYDAMTDVNSLMTSLSMYTDNTHTGNTVAASSSSGKPASTQGGRAAQKRMKQGKGKSKGGKIRQGTPQEEASLVDLLGKLAPTASQLEEAGQLNELLVLLGHFVDARTLQQELGKWTAQHQEVVADLAAHPLPQASQQQQQTAPGAPAAAAVPEWKWAVLRE